MDLGICLMTVDGWFELRWTYKNRLFGFMYGAYTSSDKLVMFKKFTVWWLIFAVILRPWALKISRISLANLSNLLALLLCMIAISPHHGKNQRACCRTFFVRSWIRRDQIDHRSLHHHKSPSWRGTWNYCSFLPRRCCRKKGVIYEHGRWWFLAHRI